MDRKRKAREKTTLEEMEEVYKKINDQITDYNRALLTTADIANSLADLQAKLDSGDLLSSWQNKNPKYTSRYTSESFEQQKDECWAYAYARGLAARIIYDGQEKFVRLPTPKYLLDKIDKSLLGPRNSLPDSMSASSLIRTRFGYDMVCHCRPSMRYPAAVENFEKFVERRVAIVSVAACFFYLPSYKKFYPKYKEVFRPTTADLVAMSYEELDDHCVLITGSGAQWIKGEYVEYWHVEDSQGDGYGDGGYIRLEKHKGLIRQIYEFRKAAEATVVDV